MAFVARGVLARLPLIAVQGAQVRLVVDLVDSFALDAHSFLLLLEFAQISKFLHIENALQITDHWVVALALVNNQLGELVQKKGNQPFCNGRRVLHCWALVDLEQPEFAVDIWEQVKAVESDASLSPLDFVPS